jgi:protein gp37
MAKRLRGRFGYPVVHPFQPMFHPERLREPFALRKPSRIFVASMGDFFDPYISWRTRARVFSVIEQLPQHRFLILTKRSSALRYTDCPANVWAGVSVTDLRDLARIDDLRACNARLKFVSFEPLLSDVGLVKLNLEGIHWVIIGGLTGPHPFRPPLEWIENVEERAREVGAAILEKDNLGPRGALLREFPQEEATKA